MLKFTFTREQVEQKRKQALDQYGLVVTGDSGTTKYMGVTVGYSYDGATLTLNVLDKPFLLPQALILAAISHAFNS